MPRKGLTKDGVVDAAIRLIEQQGEQAFSLNELARYLEVKPASLYNHIENVEELLNEVRIRIAAMLREAEMTAIAGKSGDEALFALCDAYRCFAREHIELYKVNKGRQIDKSAGEKAPDDKLCDPIFKVFSAFSLTREEEMHWHRILRAMLHGFITQEHTGGFRYFPVNNEETYQMAVRAIALGIHAAEKEK